MTTELRRRKILVVEDDPAISKGLIVVLEQEGYEAIVASDGLRALQSIRENKPDLVLLDITLPGINGFEVLRRAKEAGHDSPVIILTSRRDLPDKILGLESGAVDYVTKPFDAREVLARIRAQLRRVAPGWSKRPDPPAERTRRALAVMFTDLKDFSKTMNQDEEKGLSVLEIQQRIISDAVERHAGRIIEVIGDSFMVAFGSALEAVQCGMDIQSTLKTHNTGKEPPDQILVRIGIHMGDVIEDGGRLRGDTVNIAARLQQIARPGCVTMSDGIYQNVKGRMALHLTNVSRRKVKNISQRITVYEAGA